MKHALVSCCAVLALAACSATPSADSTTQRRAAPAPAPVERTDGSADWPRFGWDPNRSNDSTAPTGITAANVASLQRQQVHLEGTVDASPIYLAGVKVGGAPHDAFFVTTTYGKTIAVDANDGSVLWTYTPPDYSSWAGSDRITNATPVADPDRQSIYAASPDGHVQKLSVGDGRAAWSTAITLLPEREKIASSLNYFNGRVVAVTAGYVGDAPPYQGHVAVLEASSGRLEHVWNSLCSDRAGLMDPHACSESGSAMWGRAGAVIDPDTGNIFVATGNGRWDGRTNWGDAAIELSPDATRLIGAYTPSNTAELDARDLDVGSTSPALLTSSLLAQAGKDGAVRLLSVQQMQRATAQRGGEVQTVSTPSGDEVLTAPAVLKAGDATWLFVADGGGTAAWTLRDGLLHQEWRNGSGGTSPVVAGGVLYVYDPRGGLRVYDPTTGRLAATLECGAGHWNSPIAIDGRIALPEGNANRHQSSGVLDIWRAARRDTAAGRK